MPLKGKDCEGCVGQPWGDLMMMPEGSGTLGVMLMGEALGQHEETDQLPFRPQAQAGSLLERALRMAGFNRSQFTITNAVCCRPPDNRLDGAFYEQEAVEHCSVYNDRLVARRKPRAILAMGNVALRALTSYTGVAKDKQSVSNLRGWALPARRYDLAGGLSRVWSIDTPAVPVISAYHPAFIQRGNKNLLGVFIHDLRMAVHMAQHGLGKPREVCYRMHPSLDEAESFLRRVQQERQRLLCFDIETLWGQEHEEDEDADEPTPIISIQFSLSPYEGIQFAWAEPFISIAKRILALPNPKLGTNSWQFDAPELRSNGIEIEGEHHDLRFAWHTYQPDLPSNLQYIASFIATGMRVVTRNGFDERAAAEEPWKHTAGMSGSMYGIKDVDFPLRAWEMLVPLMQSEGCWKVYEEHVRKFREILVRSTDHGINVSKDSHTAFGKELDSALRLMDTKCQALYPDELRLAEPENGYKNEGIALKRMSEAADGLKGDDQKWARRTFEESGAREERWCRIQKFLPDSSKQVLAYIRAKHHKVPKNDEGNDTSGRIGLEGLYRSTRDDFYQAVLDYRTISTMRGTHWQAWQPPVVHPQYTFTPATGQLACYGGVNSLNPPKPKGKRLKDDLAVSFRRMITASPGCHLWELDFKSAHALTLGFEASDSLYMRLARIDIHSYLAAHMEGQKDPGLKQKAEQCIGWPDADLREFLKEIKKKYKSTRDDRAKPAALGYGFGLQYRTLFRQNMEFFARESDAKAIIEMMDALFPVTAKWRASIRELAHYQGFLKARSGAIRWFHDVFHYDPKSGKVKGGEDSEAAIAFEPANDAFAHYKEIAIALDGEDAQLAKWGFIIPFHDAMIFDLPDVLADSAVPEIYRAMTAKSSFLRNPQVAPDGLWIGVSVSRGLNWAEMEEVSMGDAARMAEGGQAII